MSNSLRARRLVTYAIASLAVVLGASMFAHAQSTIYSTNFNTPTYADGGLIGQDGWLITGASVVSPISVSNTATNGIVSLVPTGQDVNRVFAPAQTADSVYLLAEINLSAAQATGDYFLHLGDGGASNFNNRVYARSSGAGYQMALATSSGTPTYGTTVLNFGQVYDIVARYDFIVGAGNDSGALFVDPVDPFGVGDTPYVLATTIGIDAASISSVNLRQGGATSGATLTIDNISVAGTVPEPASLSLLAIGGLALLKSRRR